MPGGTVARAGVLGGLGLGISKYTKHPQEDAAAIRFLLRKQLESFQNGQMHPLAPNPVDYFATQDQRGSKARSEPEPLRPIVIARPTYLPPHVYEQVSVAYARAVHSVLKGDRSASVAASELEDELATFTGMRRGVSIARRK